MSIVQYTNESIYDTQMLCVPSLDIEVPKFHVACDPKQLEVRVHVTSFTSFRLLCLLHFLLGRYEYCRGGDIYG